MVANTMLLSKGLILAIRGRARIVVCWHETGCAAEGWGFYIVYIDGQWYVRDPDDF